MRVFVGLLVVALGCGGGSAAGPDCSEWLEQRGMYPGPDAGTVLPNGDIDLGNDVFNIDVDPLCLEMFPPYQTE